MSAWLLEGLVVTRRCAKVGSTSPSSSSPIYTVRHMKWPREQRWWGTTYHEVQKLTDVFAWRFSQAFSTRSCACSQLTTLKLSFINLVVSLRGRYILLYLKTTVKFYLSFQKPGTQRAFKIKLVESFDNLPYIVTNTTYRAIHCTKKIHVCGKGLFL